MKASVLDRFVPSAIEGEGKLVPMAAATYVPVGDLFGSLEHHIAALLNTGQTTRPTADSSPMAAFVLGSGAVLTVAWEAVRASHLQCLIAAVDRLSERDAQGPLHSYSIDAPCGLTFWSRGGLGHALSVASIWRDIISIGVIDPLAVQTTPRLYGNKLRLTGFVAPVVTIQLPDHAPVLDLMSGTGVVSRALARRHPVSNNDANAYAALLTRSQAIDGTSLNVATVLESLERPYLQNYERLSGLIRPQIDLEDAFFHGEITDQAIQGYAEFAHAGPLIPSDGTLEGPARLVTERYANIYFGVTQSVEIDSLRVAIDVSYPKPGAVRDLCLSALILACTTCSSGPHFAQPAKLKPDLEKAPRSMRTLVERRARSVAWEFDLALARLAGRTPVEFNFERSTQLDWRDALAQFTAALNGRRGGVYVDPPYSKLQYSRYYHVLNVILAYDYPHVSGKGRYPPRKDRFSSRFEYQPGVSKRELSALLRQCAAGYLTTFLSYSDGGFIPVEALAEEMRLVFPYVKIFTEEVRHHSQGRPLKTSRSTVLEHVLVGSSTN